MATLCDDWRLQMANTAHADTGTCAATVPLFHLHAAGTAPTQLRQRSQTTRARARVRARQHTQRPYRGPPKSARWGRPCFSSRRHVRVPRFACQPRAPASLCAAATRQRIPEGAHTAILPGGSAFAFQVWRPSHPSTLRSLSFHKCNVARCRAHAMRVRSLVLVLFLLLRIHVRRKMPRAHRAALFRCVLTGARFGRRQTRTLATEPQW